MATDLLPLIEGRRFFGREFLTWLWFEAELFETELSAGDAGDIELTFEKQIILVAGPKGDDESKLKGANPSATPEAREAVRQGKLPKQARARLRRGEQEFSFVFTADTLSLSAVKLPQVINEKDDEPFFDRIALIEELENIIETLYADFLVLRSTPTWDDLVMPSILRWVHDRSEPSVDRYRSARTLALATARGKQAKGKAIAALRPLKAVG